MSRSWIFLIPIITLPYLLGLLIFKSQFPVKRANAVDPSGYSFQRKTWWDGTRYWRAFNDTVDARIEFEYSADGSSWTENTSARISVNTSDFSIYADSSNAYILYTNGYDVEAKKASSYPGTGFAWGTATVALDGSSATNYYQYPTVAYDSNSKIWVSAMHFETGTQNMTIAADAEDGFETANTTWHGSDYTIWTGEYSGDEEAGFRFTSVAIPQGSTINTATLRMYGLNDYGPVNLKIAATDVDNSSAWSSSNRPSQQTLTTAQVDWDPSSWTTSNYNDSPSITSVIEEVVGRSGWASGNAISIGVYNDGTTAGNDVSTADYFGGFGYTQLNMTYTAHKIVARQTSSANDISAWATATTLDTSGNSNKYSVIVPRSSGSVFTIWMDGTAIESKNFNGTSWDSSPTAVDTGITGLVKTISAVADGSGNVYLAYIDDETTDQVSHRKWNGTSWSAQTLVPDATSASDAYPTISLDTTGSDLYVFWIDTSNSYIYYSTCDTSSNCDADNEWAAETTWKNTGTNTYITSSSSVSDKVFAQWWNGSTRAWDKLSLVTPIISITLTTDGTVAYGTMPVGYSQTTVALSDTQTVQNDGNVAEDFTIKTTNATGGTTWTLGGTIGTNIYKHEFSSNGGSNWTAFATADTYQSFVSNIAASATQNLDLRLTLPSGTSDYQQKSITVTVLATQH